jgi:hypothetical protein
MGVIIKEPITTGSLIKFVCQILLLMLCHITWSSMWIFKELIIVKNNVNHIYIHIISINMTYFDLRIWKVALIDNKSYND